jgi:hypothetical protein
MSLPGLTRQSILFVRVFFGLLAQTMDARVKPAHDEAGPHARLASNAIFIASPASTVPIT